jgi:sterol desaturase/sphingolipid hydroxylase (fatty acid hydroxylase superfamily)
MKVSPVITSVMALDLSDNVRHRLEHAFDLVWRIHRVHHSDPELDASTALRFHPLETLLTATLHVGVALALGIPAAAALPMSRSRWWSTCGSTPTCASRPPRGG